MMKLKHERPGALTWLAAVICAGFVSGCQSTGGPGSASFAATEIHGKTAAEIRAATVAVFRADGYSEYTSASGEMVFDKEGTRANQLAYGGLISTQEGNKVLVRVRANIVDLGGAHRLQCQAYMVRHAGDSFFEEETKLANMRSRPYQKLLDEVSNRLK